MIFRKNLITVLLSLISIWQLAITANAYELSRGRSIILDRGLQVQALTFLYYGVDVDRWLNANFSTINFWDLYDVGASLLEQMPPDTQWSRIYPCGNYGDTLSAAEMQYVENFVSMQYGDEMFIHFGMTQELLTDMRNKYAQWRSLYPNAIAYTNCHGETFDSVGDLLYYMQATEPDMIMYDYYPSVSFPTHDRNLMYARMQRYRTAGLLGIDGTGQKPIPYGQYLNLHRFSETDPLPSESYIRLNQFSSWAFGFTYLSGFTYNKVTVDGFSSMLFNGVGDSSPTPVYNYVAETNRQSRNLGPALTRLVSSGIFMRPGSGKSTSGTGLLPWTSRAGTTAGYNDYLVDLIPTVSGGGNPDFSYDDLLIGYFKPLLDDNSDYPFAEGLHFMLVNGAAQGTAAESAQWYRLVFDLANSGCNSLAHLNRNSGDLELLPLTPIGGTQYIYDAYLPGGTGDLFCLWNSANPLYPPGPQEPLAYDDPEYSYEHYYTIDEDHTLNVDSIHGVLMNDIDFQDDQLEVIRASNTRHGIVYLYSDGSLTYIPDDNWNGTDTFTYKANDGVNYSNEATVTLTVNPVNDSPIAKNDYYAADWNGKLTVYPHNGVLSNDSDIEDDDLEAQLVTIVSPKYGTLEFYSLGNFIYIPDKDYTGPDAFVYRAFDGIDRSGYTYCYITVGSSEIPGDANRDGLVNEADAHILANYWLAYVDYWDQGDFNGDGIVNDNDASILAANWGRTAAVVPEPSILVLLFGILAMWIKKSM